MHPLHFYAWLTLEVLKIVCHPQKSINNFRTKRKIKTRRHGFLDQPFGMGHRVVPPTFHKIRVYAISFQVNMLLYFSPPELSENIYFHGASFKFLRATPPRSIIYPWMISPTTFKHILCYSVVNVVCFETEGSEDCWSPGALFTNFHKFPVLAWSGENAGKSKPNHCQ